MVNIAPKMFVVLINLIGVDLIRFSAINLLFQLKETSNNQKYNS
jgi:hypothetical protein